MQPRVWLIAACSFAGVLVLPLGLILLIEPVPAASCATAATLPGPSSAAGVPTNFMPFYSGAAQTFNLGAEGWSILAAINYVESDFDDTSEVGVGSGENSAGAAGPMQIGIGGAAGDTWAGLVAQIPANLAGGAKPPSVYNEADAVYAAAALLQSDGAPSDWRGAIFDYNHAGWYVDEVLADAAKYRAAASSSPTTFVSATVSPTATTGATGASGSSGATGASGSTGTATTSSGSSSVNCTGSAGPAPLVPGSVGEILPNGLAAAPANAPAAVKAMIAAGNQIIQYPYDWGGGHCVAAMADPPGPNACPAGEEHGAPGYDCSSATDFVLWGGGFGQSVLGGSTPDSYELADDGEPGPGQWVTFYAGYSGGEGHAWIEVAGLVLDTVHGTPPTTPAGTGPRWQTAAEATFETQTGRFVARHPPGL